MKGIKAMVAIFGFAFVMTACGGPSFCDCMKNAEKGAEADMSMVEKCADKFKDMSDEDAEKKMEECK